MDRAEGSDGKVEEIVHDCITPDGMREIKVVSDKAVTEEYLLRFIPGSGREYAKMTCSSTSALSLFHGEITFPLRGALELHCEGWIKPRRFGVWRLMKEDPYHVSEVIEFLAEWFFEQVHRKPVFVFMHKLPAGIDPGSLFPIEGWKDELILLEAEWAPERCVLVGG